MADQLSFVLDNARHHLDVTFAGVVHYLKDEREKSESLQRDRDELGEKLSRANERENDLIRELKTERARLPEHNTTLVEERSHTEEHDLKCRHSCQDLTRLERELQKVKDDRVQTISEEWHKARRLREQDEQLLNLQNVISQQAERLRQEQELAAQKGTDNDKLKRELNEVKSAVDVVDGRSKRKLAEIQDQIDTERSSWQDELDQEKRKRQRIEKSLGRVKKQSESKISTSQREIGLLKSDFCDIEDELRTTRQDLWQAQSSLSLQPKSLTEKKHEISKLLYSIETLKDNHVRVERQVRDELSVAQRDTQVVRRSLTIGSDDLEVARQTLETAKTSLASFAAGDGALSVMRSICQNLSQFAQGAHQFCDINHGEYGFVTDCGVLLCSDCLKRSVPDEDETTSCVPTSIFFELDCSWCPSVAGPGSV